MKVVRLLQPQLDSKPRTFGRRAVRTLRALCEALLADTGPQGQLQAPPAFLINRVVSEFDQWIGAASSDLRRGMQALCFLIERLPPFVLGVFRPMSALPLARRIEYLEALENSRVGLLALVAVGLKIPLVVLAYETDEMLALTGFDRPSLQVPRGAIPIPELKFRRLRNAQGEVSHAAGHSVG